MLSKDGLVEQPVSKHRTITTERTLVSCLRIAFTFASPSARQFGGREDTSKKLILVWFSLANAMMTTTAKGDGICETPHQTSIP